MIEMKELNLMKSLSKLYSCDPAGKMIERNDSTMSYAFAQRELTNEIAIHESLMVAHAINEALVISYYGKEAKAYQDYYADLCGIAAHWAEDYHTPEGKMLWVNCRDRYTLVKELFDGFFASIPNVLEFCIWELESTLPFLRSDMNDEQCRSADF